MSQELKTLTTHVVASYVEGNAIAAHELPALIKSVFVALERAGGPAMPLVEPAPKPTAAQIRKSFTPEALVSFVDGRPYKMLKRHLAVHGMTPADYRNAFGLPKEYPMTAPAYSATRSALAKSIGLGARTRKAPPSPTRTPRAKGVAASA